MCKLTLFGAPTLECEGRPAHIRRRKATALLTYLAVTRQRHTRETLVTLLWPEYGSSEGRADLSRQLSTLRNALGARYFQSDRESVALDEETDLWVDVLQFRRLLQACRETANGGAGDDCRQWLAQAAGLYQADFLAGFTLPGSPAFDEWQLLQSEDLRREFAWVLDSMVHIDEARNDLLQAIVHARRRVSLDPLHEPAQRRLIGLYARNGQRAEAHRQYRACVQTLAGELGVEPHPETKQLYEQIRQDRRAGPLPPDFLAALPERRAGQPAFVSRDRELSRLHEYLDATLRGNGRVAFVTGGAGRGKTSLLQEFARRAQETQPDLIVAGSQGTAIAGAGDPFLPFREVLDLLGGNVAAPSAAGQMSAEQARRLWALLPQTTQAIVEHGPQLLDVFISARKLLARAAAAARPDARWVDDLRVEVIRRQNAPGALQQATLMAQFSNVLHHLASTHPLLITLDDLQWIDAASVGLLFHLGRRLRDSRILIVGAYRPDELAPARGAEPHPLVQVLDEFKRFYGDVFIDLATADRQTGPAFVDAYLDTEPNRLDAAFRQSLLQLTGGHPLFTVELLRDMQSRGDLLRDGAGRWCASPELDWQALPARVEAVIARRIEPLDDEAQAILTVASVQGRLFTAEVLARVLHAEKQPLLHTLSQHLAQRRRLLLPQGEVEVGSRFLSNYQFAHDLFQQYLYRRLDPGQRRRLHGAVAAALAELYAADPERIVTQLAHHYAAAGNWLEAVPQLVRAGDLARQKAALLDAAAHYASALQHWPQSDAVGQAHALRKFGECQWMLGRHSQAVESLQAAHDLFRQAGNREGAGAAQRLLGRVYWESGRPHQANQSYERALDLLEGETDSEEVGWALAGMSSYYMQLGDYDQSIPLGERALAIARSLGADGGAQAGADAGAQALTIQCLCDVGSALCGKGRWEGLQMERESLELALALNRPHDAGRAYLYIAEALVYLGRFAEARAMLQEALDYTRRMHLTYVATAVLRQLAELDWLAGRWSAALAHLLPPVEQASGEQAENLAQLYRGLTLSRIYNDLGQAEMAGEHLAYSMTGAASSLDPRLALLGELARAEAARGRPAAAVAAIREILEWADQVRYLYPNVNMALLFICRSPFAADSPQLVIYARAAWQQLRRLDRQYRTPVTAVCRLEGQGWLALAEGHVAQATSSFEQAVVRWQTLGNPYDQARALSGLGLSRLRAGDKDASGSAYTQAMKLLHDLAAQLEDPLLKTSFMNSPLLREIRRGQDRAGD